MSKETSNSTINFNYFREVADGDLQAYQDLLRLILNQQTESFFTLSQATEDSDYNLLEITAHKMKAIVALMSLMRQRQVLAEIEEAAQTNQPLPKISGLILDAHQMWQTSALELQKEISTQKLK